MRILTDGTGVVVLTKVEESALQRAFRVVQQLKALDLVSEQDLATTQRIQQTYAPIGGAAVQPGDAEDDE